MYDDSDDYVVVHAVTREVGRVVYHDYARSMLYVMVQTSNRCWAEKQWSRLLCSRYDGYFPALHDIFCLKRTQTDVLNG